MGYFEQLCSDLPSGHFITAWLGELTLRDSLRDRTLKGLSAGQAPLLRYDAARDTIEIHEAHVPPLGVIADLGIGSSRSIPMLPGDIFAVISDGFFEATGRDGQKLGTDRVAAVILKHHRAGAGRILEALRKRVTSFAGDAPAGDDRTALILKCTPR